MVSPSTPHTLPGHRQGLQAHRPAREPEGALGGVWVLPLAGTCCANQNAGGDVNS